MFGCPRRQDERLVWHELGKAGENPVISTGDDRSMPASWVWRERGAAAWGRSRRHPDRADDPQVRQGRRGSRLPCWRSHAVDPVSSADGRASSCLLVPPCRAVRVPDPNIQHRDRAVCRRPPRDDRRARGRAAHGRRSRDWVWSNELVSVPWSLSVTVKPGVNVAIIVRLRRSARTGSLPCPIG